MSFLGLGFLASAPDLGVGTPLWGTTFAVTLLAGARHAVEPDHLVAVSTLVTEVRRGQPATVRRAVLTGLSWGLGHMLAILSVTAALFVLRTQVPTRLDDLFELAVAVVLLLLGARAVRRAVVEGQRGPASLHAHGPGAPLHAHAGPPHHLHVGRVALAPRPLVVGVIHGLAGSGALVAATLGALPTFRSALGALGLFGIGAALTMGLAASLGAAVSGRLVSRRPHLTGRWLRASLGGVAGVLSVGLGLWKGGPLLLRLLDL